MASKDPLTQWDGPFPYDVLDTVGVGPDSSMSEVRDASFDLMARGMTQEERAAYDELRLVKNRLVIDFFLYRVDPARWLPGDSEEAP